MKAKLLLPLGIAAVLISSIAFGAVPVGADDRASFGADDRARFGDSDRTPVGDSDRASSPSRVADGPNATAATRPVAPDAVLLDVKVYDNGTAKWEVVYRTRLDDAETAAAFRDYAADVEADLRQYSGQFLDRMNRTVRAAERATGREMRGTDYSVRTETRTFPKRYGVVAYSFEWHGFANVSETRVRVGDALAGLVLDGKTRLCVEWPAGYEATEIRSRPETGFEEHERAAVWDGPVEFSTDEPRIVLSTAGTGEVNANRLCADRGVCGLPAPASLDAGLRSH